uniref:Uncharacterized protein n=1 Tax=Lygus hesperus TaxID=30085 RepID=A0A0K8T2B6_LYGHE
MPEGLPRFCDGCGAAFDINHALNCKKGGLVKRGHDHLRDCCAKLGDMAWGGATTEPVLREADGSLPALIADIKIQGVWDSERPAFFDTRIVNADAASYSSQDWDTTACAAAREKHAKYDRAAEDLRGSFTPLVSSCEGALHSEFAMFVKRLAFTLSEKWDRPYSQVVGWARTKLQLATIRAVNLRLRCSRRKLRCLGAEDGATLSSQ